MDKRFCRKCNKDYPRTEEYYYVYIHHGRTEYRCKVCCHNAAISKPKHPKVLIASLTEKYCKACGGTYPITSEYFRIYHKKNGVTDYQCKECSKRYHSEYYIQNKERLKPIKSEYAKKSIDKARARKTKLTPEQRKELSRQSTLWQQKNPEKHNLNCRRRHSRKRSLPSDLTKEQWLAILDKFDGCCYCGVKERMTVEHFIPISLGGELTINNIIPACLKCNTSKNDEAFFTWYVRKPFYSKEREDKILKHLHYDKNNVQQLSITGIEIVV